MLLLHDDHLVYSFDHCCQCGVCVGICPAAALVFQSDLQGYHIKIRESVCRACGLCVDFCPGTHNHRTVPEEVVYAVSQARSYLTFSTEPLVRFGASSGGSVRALAVQLLRECRFDAVYSLQKDENGFCDDYLTHPDEVMRMPNSQYQPIFWGKNLRRFNRQWRKIVLIGLPCEIKAAKRFLKSMASDVEVFSISIFCRQNKDLRYSEHVRRRLRVQADYDSMSLAFRGDGWPGCVRYEDKTVPYVVRPFVRKWFTIPGCWFCCDCLGVDAADVVFADPWGIISPKLEHDGMNLCFALTEKGKTFVTRFLSWQNVPSPKESTAAVLDISAIQEKYADARYRAGFPLPLRHRIYFSLRNLRIRASESLFLRYANSKLLLFVDRVCAVIERQCRKLLLSEI